MADHAALLERFQPRLRYDSNEAFFADSAAEWTDNPGNVLKGPSQGTGAERVIAAASPKPGQDQLDLAFLGERYPGGEASTAADVISDPAKDYRDQYVAIRQRPGYANRMYGHAREDSDGRLWLQYWFWYFYNDYNLAGRLGLHEGDWEMVQLRMRGDEPDLAVYAQHRHAQWASWDDVEKLPGASDTAVVYVARGSHASYFRPGYHETEAWYDMADGERPAPKLTLEIVGHDSPSWLNWPGRWGDTKPRYPKIESPSPDGPAQHKQWEDPKHLLEHAETYTAGKARDRPDVRVSRVRNHLQVEYDFSREAAREAAKQAAAPETLVVTVNSVDDRIQPRTYTFTVEGTVRGRIETNLTLDGDKRYDVYVSTTDKQGKPSASHLTKFEPGGSTAARRIPGLPALARAVAFVRTVLRRDG